MKHIECPYIWIINSTHYIEFDKAVSKSADIQSNSTGTSHCVYPSTRRGNFPLSAVYTATPAGGNKLLSLQVSNWIGPLEPCN